MTSSVRSLGGQNFIASFTPHETGTHLVQITFNGDTVPGESINWSDHGRVRIVCDSRHSEHPHDMKWHSLMVKRDTAISQIPLSIIIKSIKTRAEIFLLENSKSCKSQYKHKRSMQRVGTNEK